MGTLDCYGKRRQLAAAARYEHNAKCKYRVSITIAYWSLYDLPICTQKFNTSSDFLFHLVEKELFTKQQIYDRIIILGLLTKDEIDIFYRNMK